MPFGSIVSTVSSDQCRISMLDLIMIIMVRKWQLVQIALLVLFTLPAVL